MRYYMLNKPRGLITACRDERQTTVLSCLPEEEREGLFHVGRLDKDTEGLLILTDNGMLCHELMHPDRGVRKTYYFLALGDFTEDVRARLCEGVSIRQGEPDRVTAPAEIRIGRVMTVADVREYINDYDMQRSGRRSDLAVTEGWLTITEGKKHQVRRMLRAVGCYVLYLRRISIGRLRLDDSLPTGAYRPLTEEELSILRS